MSFMETGMLTIT